MSNYIDAMAAADKIRELVAHFSNHSQMGPEFLSGAEAAAEALRYMPPADVAEVVRCKDCRHCEIDYIHEGEYECFYTGAMGLTLDDFCSKAERKDEHDKSNNDN